MKLKISVNFDFGQLADKMDNLIGDYTSGYAKDSVKGSKEAINKGLQPHLEDSTETIRGKRDQPISPPLKATGKLYDSIRQEKNAITMEYYGFDHNKGFITKSNSMIPNKKVPARPFIQTTAKNKDKLDKKFMQDIRKALRSNKKVVSLG